jgi:23S rRNA (guanosine2251-2'-O)-methyltransferase
MQYIYGIHAVDSLIRQNPKSVQRLWVQEGREDKRFAALLQLAKNQGVPVARLPRAELDGMVEGRHQGVVAETLEIPVQCHRSPQSRGLPAQCRCRRGGRGGGA